MLYITSYIIVTGFIYIATNTFKQLDGALFWENKFKSKNMLNGTQQWSVQYKYMCSIHIGIFIGHSRPTA